MSILFLILFILIIWKSKWIRPISQYYDDYLAPENCIPWRGILALFIVLHHLSQHIDSDFFMYWFEFMGKPSVAMFFFFTGYGLQKKFLSDSSYKNNFLLHRLPSVCIPYFIVTLLCMFGDFIIGNGHSTYDVLSGMLSIYYITPNCWYIVCLFGIYVSFAIGMHICGEYKRGMIFNSCIFYLLWLGFCRFMDFGLWWYVSTHAVILGIVWATCHSKIIAFIKRYYWVISIPIVIITPICMFFAEKVMSYFNAGILIGILFPICIILVALKLRFRNKFLLFIGNISFELYLVHGFFVNNLRFITSDLVYTVVAIICAIVVAYPLHRFDSIVLKKFKNWIRTTEIE